MKQTFLQRLYEVLRLVSFQDLERMNEVFLRYHFWDWISTEHIKTAFWLRDKGDGVYTHSEISQAVAIPDRRGNPWPAPLLLPKIVANLHQLKLVHAEYIGKGLHENLPVQIGTETLQKDFPGGLWDGLGEVINGATHRELETLAKLYQTTDILGQRGFYIRVLAWVGTRTSGHVSDETFKTEFDDIYRAVRFSHDARDHWYTLAWMCKKNLLGMKMHEPGGGFDLDVLPLQKFGFAVGGMK